MLSLDYCRLGTLPSSVPGPYEGKQAINTKVQVCSFLTNTLTDNHVDNQQPPAFPRPLYAFSILPTLVMSWVCLFPLHQHLPFPAIHPHVEVLRRCLVLLFRRWISCIPDSSQGFGGRRIHLFPRVGCLQTI